MADRSEEVFAQLLAVRKQSRDKTLLQVAIDRIIETEDEKNAVLSQLWKHTSGELPQEAAPMH